MKLWKRLTALCLSALVCVTLLTACGRKESTDGRASLSVCVGETPATYDPIYAQQIGDQTILNHLYENLMRLAKDPEVYGPLLFLREREIVHFQRFGEALDFVRKDLDCRNYYRYNPAFDR